MFKKQFAAVALVGDVHKALVGGSNQKLSVKSGLTAHTRRVCML
jgi:hypothetical protein